MRLLASLLEKFYTKIDFKKMMIAVVIFLLFLATVFPLAMAVQKGKAGTASMPDTLMFASSYDYYHLAESYGEAGRAAYIWLRFTFDLAWPAVYGWVLLAGLGYALKTVKSKWAKGIIFLPVIGVLFDLTENVLAVVYMARFPLTTDWAIYALPAITAIKWAILCLSFAICLAQFVKLGICRLRKKSR